MSCTAVINLVKLNQPKQQTRQKMENSEVKLIQCSECSESFEEDKMTVIHDGSMVCETCLGDHYSFCEDTNEYYPQDEIYLVYYSDNSGRKMEKYVHESSINDGTYEKCDDGEYYHERDCYTVFKNNNELMVDRWTFEEDYCHCESCGQYYHNDDINYINDSSICCDCTSENYNYCDNCDEYHHIDNDCPNEDTSDLIHRYSFKPAPKFHGQSNKLSPFIGFELEVESKNGSKSEQAESIFDNFSSDEIYLKEDGSLNNGFEIVSHPMTLNVHQSKSYKSTFDSLAKLGAKSHDTSTCGLHFHLDKTKMTDTHKSRFGIFFALEKNKLEVLARRTSEQYAKFKAKNIKDKKEYSRSRSRYEAVNWENEHTVEVRIFKGTLKYETFIASMELCHAIYVFTSIKQTFCTLNDNQLWARFISFVNKNKDTYSNLIVYLDSKKDLLNKAIKLDDLESKKAKIENEINKVNSSMTLNDLETA